MKGVSHFSGSQWPVNELLTNSCAMQTSSGDPANKLTHTHTHTTITITNNLLTVSKVYDCFPGTSPSKKKKKKLKP